MAQVQTISTRIDDELREAVDLFCLTHGLSKSDVARMALQKFIEIPDDPWTLAYIDGLRMAQNDIAPAMTRVLTSLKESSAAVNEYRALILAEARGILVKAQAEAQGLVLRQTG